MIAASTVRECKFYQSRYRQRAFDLRQGVGAAKKDPIMRFTRFARGETNSPSARRVWSFSACTARLEVDSPLLTGTGLNGGKSNAIFAPSVGVKHALHCAIFRQDLARQSCATGRKAFLQGDATLFTRPDP
jgi:hypothetical protein